MSIMSSQQHPMENENNHQECLSKAVLCTEQSLQSPKIPKRKFKPIEKKDIDWKSNLTGTPVKIRGSYTLREPKPPAYEYDLLSPPRSQKPLRRQINSTFLIFSRQERMNIFLSRMSDYLITVVYPEYLKQVNSQMETSLKDPENI